MPTTKVKVSEFAKRMALDEQEVIDRLKELDGKTRKGTASISDAEMNELLEYYTQQNQVSDFEAYFADRTAEPKPAAAEKPAAEKSAKAEPKKDAPKKAEPAKTASAPKDAPQAKPEAAARQQAAAPAEEELAAAPAPPAE